MAPSAGQLLDCCVMALSLTGLGIFLKHATDEFNTFQGSNTLVWHPVLMACGVLLLLTPGLITYTADFGSYFRSRASRRSLHGALQLLGASAMVGAYGAVVQWRRDEGIPQPANRDWDSNVRAAHVYVGYIVLSGLLVQTASGLAKFMALRELSPRTMMTWHSLTGPLLYLGMLVNMLLGVYLFWIDNDSPNRGTGNYMVVTISVVAVLALIRVFCIAPTRPDPSKELQARLLG